jgi:hypothetical protein
MNRRNFLQFATGLIAARFLMPQTIAQNKPKKRSMKGWELYSWQNKNTWKFSILIGTNRNKKLEEIKAPKVVLHSLKELENTLEELATGEYITWFNPPEFSELSLPPGATIEEIRAWCKALGLHLQVS